MPGTAFVIENQHYKSFYGACRAYLKKTRNTIIRRKLMLAEVGSTPSLNKLFCKATD